jgi:hypothetical protein
MKDSRAYHPFPGEVGNKGLTGDRGQSPAFKHSKSRSPVTLVVAQLTEEADVL